LPKKWAAQSETAREADLEIGTQVNQNLHAVLSTDPFARAVLEALVQQAPGGITKLATSDYYTYRFEGEELIVSDEHRRNLEELLGCKLTEVTYPGYAGETALALPEAEQARLLEVLRGAQTSAITIAQQEALAAAAATLEAAGLANEAGHLRRVLAARRATPEDHAAGKYFRTTYLVEVLSEEEPMQSLDLSEVQYAIDQGPCVGRMEIVAHNVLSSEEAAEALIAFGSAPSFFNLDNEPEAERPAP
jgi:hypothetical protein